MHQQMALCKDVIVISVVAEDSFYQLKENFKLKKKNENNICHCITWQLVGEDHGLKRTGLEAHLQNPIS